MFCLFGILHQAATGHTFTLVNIAHIPALVDAMVAELCRQYPTAEAEEITRLLPDAFHFACANCGILKADAVLVGAAVRGMMGQNPQMAVAFGGPNVASIAVPKQHVKCPRCGIIFLEFGQGTRT